MSDNRTNSNALTKWFRDKKLRTKIFVIVGIAIIMFASTLVFTLVQMNSEINELEYLMKTDVKVTEIGLQMDIAGDEMIIAIQEHILLPEEGSVLTDYANAKSAFYNETESMAVLLSKMDASERAILDEHVNNLENAVQEIVDLAEGEDGIFWLIDTKTSENVDFEYYVELVSKELADFQHLTEDKTNALQIADFVIEFESNLWVTAAKVYLFESSHDEEAKKHVEYVYDISDATTGLSDDILEHRQLKTILADLKTEAGSDTTLLAALNEVETNLAVVTTEAIDLMHIATLLKEDIIFLEEHSATLEKESFALLEAIDEHIQEKQKEIEQQRDQTILEVIIITVVVIIISVLITYYVSRMTVRPVIELAEVAALISEGDLRQQIKSEGSRDEIGELQTYFIAMTDQLRNIVSSTQESVGILTTTSEDLLSGAEEINASAEEVASTSQAMSNGATSQTELIAGVNQDIRDTSKIVDEIIKRIQTNTEEVSQIALQTNILALNAGIEASRAGDYGRGFAVVAENVRKLSDQSKDAASQIADVAAEIADRLQNSFDKISETMINVVSVSEETAASAEEVAAAAEEMTATIEELSSAAQELTTQSESSQKMIGQFKI